MQLTADTYEIADQTDNNALNDSFFLKMNVDGAISYFWFADNLMGYTDSSNLVSSSNYDYQEYAAGNTMVSEIYTDGTISNIYTDYDDSNCNNSKCFFI